MGHCLPGREETQPWPICPLFAALPPWGGVRLGDLQEPQLLLTRGICQVTAPPPGQLHVHMYLQLWVYTFLLTTLSRPLDTPEMDDTWEWHLLYFNRQLIPFSLPCNRGRTSPLHFSPKEATAFL